MSQVSDYALGEYGHVTDTGIKARKEDDADGEANGMVAGPLWADGFPGALNRWES